MLKKSGLNRDYHFAYKKQALQRYNQNEVAPDTVRPWRISMAQRSRTKAKFFVAGGIGLLLALWCVSTSWPTGASPGNLVVGPLKIPLPWRRLHIHPASKRTLCKNNLKQIGLALHHYYEDFDCFPPRVITDANETPIHSWRVLILPYLDQQDVYDEYLFSEPWNSPHNAQLAEQMPDCFRCPGFDDESIPSSQVRTHTNYLCFDHPGGILSSTSASTIESITDGISNTLMVSESGRRVVHWMSPEDITPNRFFDEIKHGSCIHGRGVNALRADGSVAFIEATMEIQDLISIITKNGGELFEF